MSLILRLSARTQAAYSLTAEEFKSPSLSLPELQKSEESRMVGFSINSDTPNHRVVEVLFDILHDARMASFVVYPCHKHTRILKQLSNRFGLESSQKNLTLFCLDSNSRDLVQAHGIVGEEVHAFNTKFKRYDPMMKPPPPTDIFVSVRNDHNMKPPWLRDLIRSIGQSGAERAVVNAWPARGEDWVPGDSLRPAPFPCPSSILLIKPIDDGYIVVYDVRSFALNCIDLRNNGQHMKTKD